MPLITPRETVTVDTGRLHVIVQTLRAAHEFDGIPFRREIVAAVGLLKESLLMPRIAEAPTTEVYAEELWWAVHAADEIGHDRCMSAVGILFTAVDELGVDLIRQAPATDRGMTAVLEAETTVAFAEHTRHDQ